MIALLIAILALVLSALYVRERFNHKNDKATWVQILHDQGNYILEIEQGKDELQENYEQEFLSKDEMIERQEILISRLKEENLGYEIIVNFMRDEISVLNEEVSDHRVFCLPNINKPDTLTRTTPRENINDDPI